MGKFGKLEFKPSIGILQQCGAFTGCLIAVCLLFYVLRRSQNPLTLDLLVSIFLAEYNRWINDKRRRHALQMHETGQEPVEKMEKYGYGSAPDPQYDTIAAVVGYREDPTLFEKALVSYIGANACKFILVCIDGDEEADKQMLDVFKQTFTSNAAVIHLDKPLAIFAEDFSNNQLDSSVNDEQAINHCRQIAKDAIKAQGILLHGPKQVIRLCITQPHMHKKGIMFTAFIFALVISDMLGIEFLWSSDSDSWISSPDTLHLAASTIANEPKMGGASTAMFIHNAEDTIISRLNNAVYLSELYLARSFCGAVAANDCQSGPCALFRISALSPILLKWYRQTVFGHWMITNEDRHLTTCLLLEGWNVAFVSDVITATESPSTFRRYLLQQVRWARAIHIETFYRPRVYLYQSPLLFFNALRRQCATFLVPAVVFGYLITDGIPSFVSAIDVLQRLVISLLYLVLRSPYRGTTSTWLLILPAQIFYNLPMPAINLWGLATILSDSWGTTMRARKEISGKVALWTKASELGYFVLWITVVGGVVGRVIASAVGYMSFYLTLSIYIGMVMSGTCAAAWVLYA